MKLKNVSKEEQTVLDAGDGQGRTVPTQTSADFTEQCARELLGSFPAIWAEEPATPKKPRSKS